MQIGGGLTSEGIWAERAADVTIVSDTDEVWGERAIRRLITGTVTMRYPHWEKFFGFWMQAASGGYARTEVIDGRTYFSVLTLLVDHDVYPFSSLVNIDGNTIRLMLVESYYDNPAEYRAMVVERNRKVQQYIDRVELGQLTKNDLREATGLPRDNRFNDALPPEMKREIQAMLLDPRQNHKQLYNILH